MWPQHAGSSTTFEPWCAMLCVLQLVPAVTELMVAELLYLEKQGAQLPIEMLINSSGTTRQDGEIVSRSGQHVHQPISHESSPVFHWVLCHTSCRLHQHIMLHRFATSCSMLRPTEALRRCIKV